MSKKNPKLPDYATPDPIEIIKEEARQNRFNQYNPYGSNIWEGDAESGWTNISKLSPEMDALKDKQLGIAMRGATSDPFQAMAGVPGMGGIFGGLMGKVGDRYSGPDPYGGMPGATSGNTQGVSGGMPGETNNAPTEAEDMALGGAMLGDNMFNRVGQLDAVKNRGGSLKAPGSAKSSKIPR